MANDRMCDDNDQAQQKEFQVEKRHNRSDPGPSTPDGAGGDRKRVDPSWSDDNRASDLSARVLAGEKVLVLKPVKIKLPAGKRASGQKKVPKTKVGGPYLTERFLKVLRFFRSGVYEALQRRRDGVKEPYTPLPPQGVQTLSVFWQVPMLVQLMVWIANFHEDVLHSKSWVAYFHEVVLTLLATTLNVQEFCMTVSWGIENMFTNTGMRNIFLDLDHLAFRAAKKVDTMAARVLRAVVGLLPEFLLLKTDQIVPEIHLKVMNDWPLAVFLYLRVAAFFSTIMRQTFKAVCQLGEEVVRSVKKRVGAFAESATPHCQGGSERGGVVGRTGD